MTILNEDYQLNNGVKIPKLALGTWLLDDDAAEKAVTTALQLGFILTLLKPTKTKKALAAAFSNLARPAMRSL